MLSRTLIPIAAAAGLALAAPFTASAQTPPVAIPPIAEGLAPVNGLEMYYQIYGEGRPLVLLHGAYTTIELSFGGVIPGLAEGRQVIAVELQGHGRTADVPGRPITYEQLADDVAALLTHLAIPEADVFGYSLGGGVALQLAIRHPDMVGKLVIASMAYTSDGWYPEVTAGIQQLTPEAFAGTPLEIDYMRLAPNPADWPVLMAKLKPLDLAPYDWTEAVAAIEAPTLIIIGDADGVRPEHAVDMLRLLGGGVMGDYAGIPDTRLAVMPGTSHVGVMLQPEMLLGFIVPFLNDETPGALPMGP